MPAVGVLGNNIKNIEFFSTKKISIVSNIKKIDVYCMGSFSKCEFNASQMSLPGFRKLVRKFFYKL